VHHLAFARTSRPPLRLYLRPALRTRGEGPSAEAADQAGARAFLAGHSSLRVTGRPAGRHGLPGSHRDLSRTVLPRPAAPARPSLAGWP
jgi:hypothetical protein